MQFIQSVAFFTEKKRILLYHIQNVFHRSEWGPMHLLQACRYKYFVGSVKLNIKKGNKRKKQKINISRQYVHIKLLWCCCCWVFLSEEIYNCVCSISRNICTGNVQDVRGFSTHSICTIKFTTLHMDKKCPKSMRMYCQNNMCFVFQLSSLLLLMLLKEGLGKFN